MPRLQGWRRYRVELSAVTMAVVVALALYDLHVNDGFTVGTWLASELDWLFIASNVVVLFYGVLPILEDRDRAATVWRRFREKPEAIAGAVWLVVFYLLGTVGLALAPMPRLDFVYANQPPVWAAMPVEKLADDCLGRVVDGMCHGTWQYPLGTDLNGYGMGILLLQGLHITLYVALISLALIVPLALVVGTVAGYHGGLLDDVSMRAVEVLDAVPPLVVYLLFIWITGESLLVIVLLFGFLGWGGAARVVRSEARRLRKSEFVEAARALGGDDRHVLGKHVVPAVSVVAIPTATQQVPVLLLTEAGLAYLGLESYTLMSMGNIIARGTTYGQVPMVDKWWVSAFSVGLLVLTVMSFKLVGDALVEALDPR
jgi:peptide/nickel transport system permease protein